MRELHIGFMQSLSGRLFRMVFGGYVILAIFVTVIQLLLEYSSIQTTISKDLTSLGNSFNGGVSEAMWEMDEALLKTIAEGISQSSIITGVKIMSDSGVVFAEVGSVPLGTISEPSNFLSDTQFYTSNLQKESVFGIRDIGVMTVYSDRSVAISRVTYSFFVILINSLIKTAGLWIIFYIVITKSLSRPLSQLTNVISQMEFAAESKEPISLDYTDKSKQDELSRLMAAMDKMQQRLYTAHCALSESNHNLEKKVEERTSDLADALAFNETVLYSSPIPVGVYSATGQCVFANHAYANFVSLREESLREESLLAQNFNDIESWKQSSLLKDCKEALETHKPRKNETSVVSSDGEAVWFEYQIIPTVLKGLPHLLIQFFDLSARKEKEEELLYFAMHDSLTRLPNRRLLLERMSHVITTSKRNGTYSAILFLDLNEFKWLNDTHGHDIGDILLCQFAERLLSVVRETDTVARIGGDEFIVLLEDCHKDQKIATEYTNVVLSKIEKTLSDEYILKDIHYTCTASIGVTLFMGDEKDSKQILKEADIEMYENKRKMSLT